MLTPASASVMSGTSQAYTVEGFDAANNDLGADTGATLSITPDGSCTAYTCTATTAGAHTVTATDGTAQGTATLTVTPGPLDHLALSPASSLIASGGSQTYTVEGFDAANNDLGPDSSATLAITPDGSCTGYTCTATTAGAHTVTATDGDGTGTAKLTVATTGTYPVSFTASVNVPEYVVASVQEITGAEITVTGVEAADCNSPTYTKSFCDYDLTGATGTLYGTEQDGTYTPCSASAQEYLYLTEADQPEGYFGGSVELGNPPDGNGEFGIEVEAGAPDRTDIDGGCLAGIGVGSPGGDLSAPWVPGSQTSSWTAYGENEYEMLAAVGTVTVTWQY
jgi:hypothetical protein